MKAITCKNCGKRVSKMPSTWTLDDCCFYCPDCWKALACHLCGHHDPKGIDFKGAWNCRVCRHKRQVKEKAGPSHAALQKLIIDESADCCTSSISSAAKWEAVKVLSTLETDSEDEDDVVCDLPDKAPKALEPYSRRRHVVLLVDASGSMRNEDVDLDTETSKELGKEQVNLSRLDAAELCSTKFAREHAQARPHDVFSVVTFHEKASVVANRISSAEMAHMAFEDRAANGTFYVQGLSEAARLLKASPELQGEVVLLSDGRPADTKQALQYFQDQFIRGQFAGVQLHGIGFGNRVESFAALQQLACLTGGTFVLSGSTVRGLCNAFSSVSSTITASSNKWVLAEAVDTTKTPQLKVVDFELPEVGIFGKKHVLRFHAARISFSYDGAAFHRQEFAAGPVVRRRMPYMRGGMRLVYGFQDEEVAKNGSWMVAKCSRYSNEILNSQLAVEAHAKSTAVARYFAARFNGRLQALGGEKLATLLFVPCFVYKVEGDAPINEPKCFAAERYLPGVFLKYNSNNGYVADALLHNDAVQSFLHFSFEESGGHFIVADLQGVARESEVLLTDPQVLSLTREYGAGDLGTSGYLRCLRAHRCGQACKKLGLTPISSSRMKRIESTAGALSGSSWQQVNHTSQVHSANSFGDWEKVSETAAAEYTMSQGQVSKYSRVVADSVS
ncbi:unnamed protein product [Durusdinium trenchii]|uniref:Alpha-type protein kinase domain-containing protein n=1 Tax=Durusdinium trenchii TaxID=1381693 RepID=A0ABP0LE09_9DINO